MVSRRKSLLDVGMWFRKTFFLTTDAFHSGYTSYSYCQREILHAPFQEFQKQIAITGICSVYFQYHETVSHTK
jgi:hypothetical protein